MSYTKNAIALCNSVIMVADRFIEKVKQGRARSRETYSDMHKLKWEAELLKSHLEEKLNQKDNDSL